MKQSQDIGEYIQKLVDRHGLDWADEVKALRLDTILKGKGSPKLSAYATKRGKSGPKFDDPLDTTQTGAITPADALFLYLLVCEYRPECIVEAGSWYGTSSIVMAKAMKDLGIDGHIYTCDKNNVLVDDSIDTDMITYENRHSTNFLTRLRRSGVKIDMFFADATLTAKDVGLIMHMFRGPIRFISHDYGWLKGTRNAKLVKAKKKGLLTLKPRRAPYRVHNEDIDNHIFMMVEGP